VQNHWTGVLITGYSRELIKEGSQMDEFEAFDQKLLKDLFGFLTGKDMTTKPRN
jgi:hypothetical protein